MDFLRGILIDPDKHTVEEVRVASTDVFDPLYKLCRCDTIQVLRRHSNGREFLLFCDEEALLKKDRPKSFAIRVDEMNDQGEEILGPAIILGEPDGDVEFDSAPDWCTAGSIKSMVMWAERSHSEFPDHWLVKILMVSGSEFPRFACFYMNPYRFNQLQTENPGLSSKELRPILLKNGALGEIDYKPQDFGFSAVGFDETIEAAPTDELTMSIITATIETIRKQIARDVLKIDPAKLFLMREPLTAFTKMQGG